MAEAREFDFSVNVDEDLVEMNYEIPKDLDEQMKKYQKVRDKRADYEINRVCYPTGFISLDLMLGKDCPSKVKEGEIIKNRGLRDGIQFSIGGTTHKGKSVFAMNVAGNVVRPLIQKGLPAWIEYFTPEEGLEPDWMMACAGLGQDALEKKLIRITHRHKEHTSIEGLFKLVTDLYELKTSSGDKFKYETTDMYGRPIKKYVPTVIVCDSWTNCRSKALDIKDEASTTFHARRNNINGMFLEQMRPLMLEANIMFFAIVHVGDKIGIDVRFTPKDYAALGATVNISGGKTFQFETEFGIILNKYLHAESSKVEECLGVKCPDSKTVNCIVYKSRFAIHDVNSQFNLVFDPDFGFNPLKSLFVDMLVQYDIFEAAGAYKYLKGHPEDKFYKADFYKKFLEDAEFRKKASELFTSKFERYTRFVENKTEVQKTRNLLDALF